MASAKSYDVIIVGAGPAGAAAALRAREREMRVLVIDRKRLPRHKTCGGLVTSETLAFIEERFGALPADVQATPHRVKGWRLVFPENETFEVPFDPPGAVVERKKLDAFLMGAAQADVHAPVAVEAFQDGAQEVVIQARVQLGGSDEPQTTGAAVAMTGQLRLYRAHYVIGCDGAEGAVLPAIDQEFHRTRAVKGQSFVGLLHLRGRCALDPAYRYSYFLPETGAFNCVSIAPGRVTLETRVRDPRELKQAQMNLHRHLVQSAGLRMEGEIGAEFGPQSRMAANGDIYLGHGRILLAGEAAGLTNFLGHGVLPALQSGYAAASAVIDASRGLGDAQALYRKYVQPAVDRAVRENMPGNLLRGEVGNLGPLDPKRAFAELGFLARRRNLRTIARHLGQLDE